MDYKNRDERPWLRALQDKLDKDPLHWRPVTCRRCHGEGGQLVRTSTGYVHKHCR